MSGQLAANPLQPFLREQGWLLLDGGLATHLETAGHDLSSDLWSAEILRTSPAAIRRVHLDYLHAGADCIISSSYQASIPGFVAAGLSEREASLLIEASVAVACDARDLHAAQATHEVERIPGLTPLVAASVGPYGAYLADGSEYTGDYGIDRQALIAFHRQRLGVLAGTRADLLAIETIPSGPEAEVLLALLDELVAPPAWISFSCPDGEKLADGTPLEDVAAIAASHESIVALGVNCLAPSHVLELVHRLAAITDKPIVAYPNSGETYDGSSNLWHGNREPAKFADLARIWRSAGATILGGCCRTGPAHISAMRRSLLAAGSV